MQTEADCFQIGGRGLRQRAAGGHGMPNTAPYVGLVRNVARENQVGIIGGRSRTVQRPIHGLAILRWRYARRDQGVESRSRLAQHIARFLKTIDGRAQGLVGDVYLFLQRIQLRILENLPPVSFLGLIARLRRFPVCIFLVSGRNFGNHGLCIFGSDRASADCQARQQKHR